MEGISRKFAWTAGVLIAASVVVRLALVFYFSSIPLFYDQVYYNIDAIRYLNGENWVPYWPPGLPFFLAGIYLVTGPSMLGAHAGMFALSMAMLAMVYILAVKMGFSRTVALSAVLMVALLPGSFYYNGVLVTQTPAALLLLLVAYFLIKYQDDEDLRYLASASLACGLLALLRAGGVFLYPVLVYSCLNLKKHNISKRMAAVSLPFVAVIGIWVWHLWTISGHLIFINAFNSYNLYIGNNQYTHWYRTWEILNKPDVMAKAMALIPGLDNMDASTQESSYVKAVMDYLAARPDLFLVRVISRVFCFWSFDTNAASTVLKVGLMPRTASFVYMFFDALANCFIILLVFLSPGIMGTGKKNSIVFLLSLAYMFQFLLAFSHPSYHYPVLVLLAPLASGTLYRILAGKEKRYSGILTGRLSVSMISLFILVQSMWVIMMINRFKT